MNTIASIFSLIICFYSSKSQYITKTTSFITTVTTERAYLTSKVLRVLKSRIDQLRITLTVFGLRVQNMNWITLTQ